MDVLRCQTPEMVRKEIWMHLLAYNLIRGVMAEAAEAHGKQPRQLSFKGALQTMTAFQDALRWATPSDRAAAGGRDAQGDLKPRGRGPIRPGRTPGQQASAETSAIPDGTPTSGTKALRLFRNKSGFCRKSSRGIDLWQSAPIGVSPCPTVS